MTTSVHIARACASALDGHCDGYVCFLATVDRTYFSFHLEREEKGEKNKKKLAYSALPLSYIACDILAISLSLFFGSLFDASCMFVSVCACVCT